MHDRRCFPVKTNKNIKKNSLAPREILWKCFGTQCVKHRNNRNLRINVLFYVHLRPSAPKVLKSSSQISQNVRKQLGIKL